MVKQAAHQLAKCGLEYWQSLAFGSIVARRTNLSLPVESEAWPHRNTRAWQELEAKRIRLPAIVYTLE